MNENKFYAVIISWAINYESDARVVIFKSEDNAKKYMQKDYKDFMDEWGDEDFNNGGCFEKSANRYQEGDWSRYHITWDVQEVEVADAIYV